MVCSGSGNHELVLLVAVLDESNTVFNQSPWVHQGCLVANELRADLELVLKDLLHEFFKELVVSQIDAVPELWLTVVEVVDAVKVVVFLVPAKHRLPSASVNVRIVDTQYFLVSKPFSTHFLD